MLKIGHKIRNTGRTRFKVGQKPWNLGIKMNDEFKEKCKERQLGKFKRTPEGVISFKLKMIGRNNPRWKEDRSQVDMNKRRNWAPECIEWRTKVFERDGWKRRMIDKNCKGQLEAHHILSWRDYPELRFISKNGITLCHAHHPRGRAKEKRLEPVLMELVSVSKIPQF